MDGEMVAFNFSRSNSTQVAMISRFLKIIGLFCKRALQIATRRGQGDMIGFALVNRVPAREGLHQRSN